MVGRTRVFLEIEGFDRICLGSIRQPRQETRHRQTKVLGVVRLAQGAPGSVLGGGEDLGQVTRIGELLPGVHLHQGWGGAGDERRHRRRRHLGHFGQQLHIGCTLVKVVITHQAAEGLATELAVFFFVDLLEQRALVPVGALVALECLAKLRLGDVHHADLELLIGLGVVDHVMQATPCPFELLEVFVVQDLVDLVGQLLVDRRDHVLDRLDHVLADQLGLRQCLLRQRLDGRLDGASGFVGLGLEFLLQQGRKVIAFQAHGRQGGTALRLCHSSLLVSALR